MVATRLPLPRLVDDLFDDLFDRARIGMSLPLLIRGTHGAGKSEQLRRMQLRAADMLVVEGAAVASDSGVPYAALRSLTRSAETAARQLVDASVFHRLWGDGSGDALDAHGGVLTELERFFTRLGELAPTLLAFDDLHHADAASCQAMLHLVRHLRGSPVFMVLTSAHEPLLEPRLAATLERYQRASELEIIELGPLDRAAVRAVVASRLDAEPDPALLDHIVELSKGNAMFVVESVATLDSLGLIVCESGRARLASETPIIPVVSRPRRVIEGVLALGDEAHRLAVVAAWATSVSVSDLPALAASSGLPRAEADLAFDRLVAAGVLETAGDRFQFAVPLVQAALRGELGPARRAALEPIHDSPSLIELIIAEGDTSSASQPQSAIEMYRRALDLQDRASVDDPTLRLKLAHALTFAARHREGAGLAIDLLESPEPDVRVEACELAVAALRSANRHDEAASILDNALGDPAMCSPRLLLARAELSFWCDDLRAARVHLLAARRAGLTELEPVAVALERELDLAAGLPQSTAALDARDHEWADASPPLQAPLARLALTAGAVHEHHASQLPSFTDAIVPPDTQAGHRAWTAYRIGNWADAERSAHEALGPFESYGEPPNLTAVGVLAALHAERGSFSRADNTLHLADEARYERLIIDWARALLAVHRGEDATALRVCADTIARLRQVGRVIDTTLLLPLQAQAAVRRRDQQLAITAERQLHELDAALLSPVTHVHSLLTSARVHDDVEAAAQAVEVAQQHGLVIEAATALGAQGIAGRDAALLIEAHHALGELGAVARQREVTRHLRRLGRRVPGKRTGDNELTSTESEIASLVGLGLTNRQIAQQTGLSIKTVETYLSRVFAKTGSRSRTELAIYVNARDSTT